MVVINDPTTTPLTSAARVSVLRLAIFSKRTKKLFTEVAVEAFIHTTPMAHCLQAL